MSVGIGNSEWRVGDRNPNQRVKVVYWRVEIGIEMSICKMNSKYIMEFQIQKFLENKY